MMALTEARHRGYAADAASSQKMTKEHAAGLGPQRDNLLSGACTIPGMATTTGYAAIAMYGEGYRPDSLTDGFVHCLLVSQEADGRWHEGGARPPLSPTTPIPATALAARVLKLYAIPAFARDVEAGVARARAYLLSAKPVDGRRLRISPARIVLDRRQDGADRNRGARTRRAAADRWRMGADSRKCNRTHMPAGCRCRPWRWRTRVR